MILFRTLRNTSHLTPKWYQRGEVGCFNKNIINNAHPTAGPCVSLQHHGTADVSIVLFNITNLISEIRKIGQRSPESGFLN